MMDMRKKINLDPAFWTRTSWIQLLYGVWVNIAHLEIGLAFGFPAVQVPQLTSQDSAVQITRNDASWIASVLTLFSPIGCLLSGYVMDRFGRKIMLVLCQGPMCIGWLYTALAESANHIIIGRAITGIGCGMAMGPPRIYCTEISLPNMRGVIGAFPSMALSIGITVQAGLGSLIDWKMLCYICCGLALINLFTFIFLPETPYYVLKTQTAEKARITLQKFRANNYKLEKEMKQLIEFKTSNNIRKLSVLENLALLFTRASCKPFTLINIYILISQTSGVSCIVIWTIEILQAANSSMDANFGNFLLAITRLVVGAITSVLLFSVGRKPLALTSAIGVSCICLCLGFYINYYDHPSIIPQICFMLYTAFASLGYSALPFLMAAELYPLQVRGTLSGLTVSITSLLVFATTKVFPLLTDILGLANVIVIFGGFSLCGAAFLYFFLPETKELTLQEIEEYYNERRPTLISQRRIESMQALAQKQQERAQRNAKRKLAAKVSSNVTRPDYVSSSRLEAQKRLSMLLGRSYRSKTGDHDKNKDNSSFNSAGTREYVASSEGFISNEQLETNETPSKRENEDNASEGFISNEELKTNETPSKRENKDNASEGFISNEQLETNETPSKRENKENETKTSEDKSVPRRESTDTDAGSQTTNSDDDPSNSGSIATQPSTSKKKSNNKN